MDHTEHTVTVNAPAHVVYDVLADVEGYARLFPPTESVTLMESGDSYQIARLVVDVSGERLSWITRRDLDAERRVIAYRQLETAPLVAHMSGEWRALELDESRTQLVLTHDFEVRRPADGRCTKQEAIKLVQTAVERNSHDDLAAVQREASRRAETIRSTP
jgi:aromatase